ncbi:MAG: CopG family transcriptional regulator [Mesorhizobium sp.]|jgi:RHH-type rel operon transcriptional repressor/antitoxin RelB|uniref:type II toxin-antitoxin system RelB family antitoxin n=1 Tax=Mesorhizobium sp. TaxID=1871066 RepID=UPI000FE4E349|nr:DUF6290 family protein [Mesorhizobium sp.]RWK49596.1 MAG: CopG family transcriptional regulator [Mesorhizobium sp.]RWK73841.1 MAG: CopG family transcriptional regulator [Mesorhizobium sp.]TIP42289.1 MAG: CopG family transcriptional regulator [Mesorhizobium sp.]TJW90718.1 MAG: CopG family transcriptional regulator [Mesorhizobium sp.]
MITVKLPQNAEKLLADMAKASGRTIEQVAVEAILETIEDWQDARIAEERLIALERLNDGEGDWLSLAEVKERLGLDDASDRSDG